MDGLHAVREVEGVAEVEGEGREHVLQSGEVVALNLAILRGQRVDRRGDADELGLADAVDDVPKQLANNVDGGDDNNVRP